MLWKSRRSTKDRTAPWGLRPTRQPLGLRPHPPNQVLEGAKQITRYARLPPLACTTYYPIAKKGSEAAVGACGAAFRMAMAAAQMRTPRRALKLLTGSEGWMHRAGADMAIDAEERTRP